MSMTPECHHGQHADKCNRCRTLVLLGKLEANLFLGPKKVRVLCSKDSCEDCKEVRDLLAEITALTR